MLFQNILRVLFCVFRCDQAALWMVQSVRLSVRLSTTTFPLCPRQRIIMKFPGVITIDRSDVHAKDQGQMSKVKVTEDKTNFAPIWAFLGPIVLQGCPSNFKVARAEKSAILTRNWCFRTVTQGWIHRWLWKMHRGWSGIEEVPYCFSMSFVKFPCHMGQKNRRFWPKSGVSVLWLQFEFTDGYIMMYKAWNSIEEVPYCFSRSLFKFRGRMGQRNCHFIRIGRFRTVAPV